MGNNSAKETQIQSQPVLPVFVQQSREFDFREQEGKNPLSKREIIDGFMDKLKKGDDEKKDLKCQKKADVKIKKVKENAKLDKQNDFEGEDIEPVTFKSKEVDRSSNKKSNQKEREIFEAKTLPLVPLTDHCENRLKKCRVSKML